MRRSLHRMLKLAAGVALLWAAAAPIGAQLQSGDLYGKVRDTGGQPLPGVSVTLTGVGAPQVQVTDAEGAFRFLNLYPGSYALKAELDGFSPLDVPKVDVRLAAKANVELTMSSTVKDVVTVTTESPLLDERRETRGTNISADELNKIPTARDPWSLLSQAPGVLVDRVNVGGNESGQQSNFVGGGATSRDNTFAVDGVILTDMNAVGGSATYFDFGAFEEVELTVSSADVTSATSGVTVNQITKRGTNDWRAAGRFFRTDGQYQAKPELSNGNRIDKVDEYGADIGGPILKDKLWIWASEGKSDIGNLTPTTEGASQLDRTQLKDFNSKLNFQLGQANSGVAHFWTNDKLKDGRGAGPFNAPETTLDQTTPSDIYKGELTHIFGSSLYLTGLWSRDDGSFTLSPKGGLNADRFRDADGVLHGTTFDFTQHAIIDQGRLDASYFVNTGKVSHELKFGAGYRTQDNDSLTVWPRGKYVNAGSLLGIDDLPDDVAQVVFPRNKHVKIKSSYDSAWVQDTLTIDHLTINAGLRYDRQKLENGPTSDPGNPVAQGLLPAINFPGNDAGGFKWNSVVPRIGVTYALGEDRKTLLRGSFSQYAEQLGQLPLASRVNPIGYSYAYFYFTDANHNLVLDPGEVPSLQFGYTYNIDPDNPAALVTPNVTAKNLKPSMTDEVTFGFEHALRPDLVAGLTLTARQVRDVAEQRLFVSDDETGVTRIATRDDYVLVSPAVATLPNGKVVSVPVYDLRDGLTPTGGTLYLNGDRKQKYLGLSASFTKRMSNRWMARGNFTWADWKWAGGKEYRQFADPTDLVTDGLGFGDRNGDIYIDQSGGNKADIFINSKWSFNLNGLYQVAPDRPWGFDIGANITGRQGFPAPPFVRRSGAAGRRDVQLADLDEFRNDNLYLFDLHLGKDFKIRDLGLSVSLDGFNMLNKSYSLQTDRQATVTTPYQKIETLSPRVLRAGLTFRFR